MSTTRWFVKDVTIDRIVFETERLNDFDLQRSFIVLYALLFVIIIDLATEHRIQALNNYNYKILS